jgi:uncharacterized protein (TIGR02421 family)
MSGGRLDRVKELDERLASVVDSIKVLSALAWPRSAEEEFLQAFRAGAPELPKVTLTAPDHSREIQSLEELQADCDREHPLDNLVFKSARSYESAARMLTAVGTPDFTRYSIEVYGKPDDVYRGQDFTALDAADYFLERTDDLVGGHVVPATVATIPAEEFAIRLQKAVDDFFVEDKVEVVLDQDLSSKAIAGSKRIRLRAGAVFSDLDLDQLLYHEAHVHAATMLNGRRQTNLKLLSLGAPRTTRTQEGLAVLSELLTLSLDVSRLRRLALRVKAIARVLDGADFIDVFRTFLEAGQSEEESYQSTVRCFRGGDVRGGVAFTNPEFASALFAGRLTLGDVVELAPYCETGFILPPRYIPHWARDLRTLTSAFAFNAFLTRADMAHLSFDRFVAFEEAVAEGTLPS